MFTHGVPGGAKLRAAIYHAKTGAAVLEQVDAFFAAQTAAPAAEAAEEAMGLESAYSSDSLVCD